MPARQTRIIATLGPATSSYESIRALHLAGVNFFRLNFSHGSHEDHAKNAAIIRRIEQESGAEIGIIADLQGPKLRIGTFAAGKITLHQGMQIRFDLGESPGDETRVEFPHPEIIAALSEGAQIMLDDGNVGMKIVQTGPGYFIARVEHGTELSDRKGVNVPDLSVPVSALTEKDHEDLEFALTHLKADWIALSFVQSAADIEQAKQAIRGRAGIIAKIEKPAAVANIKSIMAASDAVMLARGDLGVEIPLERVPVVQKTVTYEGRLQGKPVIIATQMLESMRDHPRPTRAEAGDVAQAVFDGAHAVMLSGETAVGKYPVQTVEIMDRICREMESGKIRSLAMQAGSYAPALRQVFELHRHRAPAEMPGGTFSPAPR